MADRVGQQLGYYRLLRKIGQGAFAEVYLGEHQYLERLAAIKVLHVQIEPETQEQFRREARTIAHLQHPHILQVLEFGIDDQTPYLVMEYTPGGTLRSRHPKGTRLPLEQIVIYVKQIASALDYAHQQRVIHRDIKPDNLLLNAKDEIVLSDFGLAVVQRTLDSLSTQNPAGTPLYMAPEQIQRKPCAASDQYALGIMVYEWLAGEAPFRGALFEVFSQHLYQPPPSLREHLPHLPIAVEEAVFKALAKDPAHRFAFVTDFASALEQACDATQPLTLPGLPKQRTPEPAVSSSTQFVPSSTAREHEASSSSTQPVPMTVSRTEPGEEVVPAIAPGPSLHRLPVSKQVKPSVSQSNRQRFLRRVRAFWIEGLLEHSLHGAALIALGLQEQLDALANPWHLVLHHPDTPPRSFPLGTRITDVYDAANGELLILGAPGSGKTTLLLELARDLLDRAEQDEQHLMPVVFPLSSWAAKQQPLTEWMVEELISKYQVPRKLARAWVEADQILPLLDGLDEVPAENRTACIETINTYHQEHGLLPLVVCSRSADYLAQTARVRLTSAVTIQSLTQQQVDDYLASGGEALWALRVALHQDVALRDLTETPLMLSILTLTYHDMPVEDLLREGVAPTRQQVFEHYVERMLTRRGDTAQYQTEQVRNWLTRLAKQLGEHNQTVFYIEQMQPNWLEKKQLRRIYQNVSVRLSSGLIGWLVGILVIAMVGGFGPWLIINGLVSGFIGVLISGRKIVISSEERTDWPWKRTKHSFINAQYVRVGLLVGVASGALFGLIGGSLYVLAGGPFFYGQFGTIFLTIFFCMLFGSLIGGLIGVFVFGFILQNFQHMKFGLFGGLIGGLIGGLYAGLKYGLESGLRSGLELGLLFMLIGIFLSVLLDGRTPKIQPTEILNASLGNLGRSLLNKNHLRNGLIVGLLVWLIFGIARGLLDDLTQPLPDGFSLIYLLSNGLLQALINNLDASLYLGLIIGLLYWLFVGLFSGLTRNNLDDYQRVSPNQGIWYSMRNSMVVGFIGCFIIVLCYLLAIVLRILLINGIIGLLIDSIRDQQLQEVSYELYFAFSNNMVILGLTGWSLCVLLSGGLPFIEHFTLRFFLWRTKSIPWSYPRFLGYATEHILLRKVGGGYIFIHRLLLEYFASLDTTPTPDAARAKKEQVEPAS